jgi:hypothetical protein
MNILWLVSYGALWGLVLLLGFHFLGLLRTLALLRWRLEQLEATTPRRVGRDGLRPGRPAPDFTLPSAAGTDVSLHDLTGHRVLLVFTQNGCQPCHRGQSKPRRRFGRVSRRVVRQLAAHRSTVKEPAPHRGPANDPCNDGFDLDFVPFPERTFRCDCGNCSRP